MKQNGTKPRHTGKIRIMHVTYSLNRSQITIIETKTLSRTKCDSQIFARFYRQSFIFKPTKYGETIEPCMTCFCFEKEGIKVLFFQKMCNNNYYLPTMQRPCQVDLIAKLTCACGTGEGGCEGREVTNYLWPD